MNTRATLAIVSALLMTAPAFAQSSGEETSQDVFQQRIQRDYLNEDDQHNMPGMKHLKAAEIALHNALPIYQNYRHRAEKLIQRAHEEARMGNTAAEITSIAGDRPMPMVSREGSDASQFSPTQVSDSQKSMMEAIRELRRAVADMGAVGGKLKADIELAITDIRSGIDLHPSF